MKNKKNKKKCANVINNSNHHLKNVLTSRMKSEKKTKKKRKKHNVSHRTHGFAILIECIVKNVYFDNEKNKKEQKKTMSRTKHKFFQNLSFFTMKNMQRKLSNFEKCECFC